MEAPITTQPGWQDLFRANSGPVVRWRVLRRRGEPLLALPESARTAARALALYPAQTAKARLVRNVLRGALQLNLPLPLERVEVPIDSGSPFARFLTEQAGTKHFPATGIFCGNPRTAGRRFILLLFGEQNEPARVVKAGLGKAAMNLVEREKNFLTAAPATVAGIPKLSGSFRDDRLEAFATEYLEGEFSSAAAAGQVAELLNAWVVEGRSQPLSATAPWQELEPVIAAAPRWQRLARLGVRAVCRVIGHGDFTPWNLKLDRRTGRVMALDWERGQLSGVPGWDWFHFVVQSGVLVKKLSGPALREELEALLRSDDFAAYAHRCGLAGVERELALAYLLYNVEVLQPSEGRAQIRALLEQLTDIWTSDSKS